MKIGHTVRQTSAVVVGLAAIGIGTTVLAAPASAMVTPKVTCGWKPANNSDYTVSFTTNGVNIRSGPSTSCTSLGLGYTSNSVYVRCEGSGWDYITDRTTGVTGWSAASYIHVPMTGEGEIVLC